MGQGELEKQLMQFSGKMYRGRSPDIADAMSDQIDFPIAGGSSIDAGEPRYRERVLHGMNRVLDHVRSAQDSEYDAMAGWDDENDWRRR